MATNWIMIATVITITSANLLRSHNYWFTAPKAAVEAMKPGSDKDWNYCDLKCLYLERYYPVYDFCFITFTQQQAKPNFGACYVVKATSAGSKSYGLWNSVATNAFYDTYCGKET